MVEDFVPKNVKMDGCVVVFCVFGKAGSVVELVQFAFGGNVGSCVELVQFDGSAPGSGPDSGASNIVCGDDVAEAALPAIGRFEAGSYAVKLGNVGRAGNGVMALYSRR